MFVLIYLIFKLTSFYYSDSWLIFFLSYATSASVSESSKSPIHLIVFFCIFYM